MANRYWVGGFGNWDGATTTHWSTAPAITFTASRSGTTLTTTGSPSLAIGMTVWDSTNTSLGTITGGSGNSWTMSASGSVGSQSMTAATIGASVPTSTDDVVVTATAGAPNFPLSINIQGANCNNFSITNPTGSYVTLGWSANLNVFGNFISPTANLNHSVTGGTLVLKGTTTGLVLDVGAGSNICPGLTVNGVGGYYTMGNNYPGSNSTGSFSLLNGTLDIANYTISSTLFVAATGGARALKGNTGTVVTLYDPSSVQYTWDAGSGGDATLTVDMANANLIVGGANSYIKLANYTYGNLTINSTALVNGIINSNNAIVSKTLTIGNRASSGVSPVAFNGNITIGNLTALSGTNATMRTAILGSGANYGANAPTYITSNGTVSLTNVDFADITANGTSAPWSGNRLGNAGNSSNITFATGTNVYWVGSSNANWGSNSWSTTQAGTADANTIPLGQDTAIFDATYPAAGNTITYNANYFIGDLDTSARTSNALTLALGTNLPVILGNVTLSANTTITGTAPNSSVILNPRNKTTNITSAGATWPSNVTVFGSNSGNVSLVDTFVVTGANTTSGFTGTATFVLSGGNLNLNNQTLYATSVSVGNSNAGINFGTSGVINLSGNARTVWFSPNLTNYSTTGTSNINLIYSGATGTRTITSGNSFSNEQYLPSFNITAGSDIVQTQVSSKIRNIDCTGFTGNLSLASTTFYGNVKLSSGMIGMAAASTMTFSGGNAYLGTSRTLTTFGKSNAATIVVNYTGSSGVTLALQDDLLMNASVTAAGITIASGTFDLNGKNANVSSVVFSGINVKGISLGSGNLNVFASGTVFNAAAANVNTTITPGTGYILMSNATTAKTFDGGNRTYNNLIQAGAGNLTIVGNNTLNTLGATVANTAIIFTAGTTTNVSSSFNIVGNVGNLITLKSTTPGTKFTLTSPGATVTARYLSITDSNATGGTFWLDLDGVNGGNNLGWLFNTTNITFTGVNVNGITITP